MSKDLQIFVQDFATSMERIDKIVPPAKTQGQEKNMTGGLVHIRKNY